MARLALQPRASWGSTSPHYHRHRALGDGDAEDLRALQELRPGRAAVEPTQRQVRWAAQRPFLLCARGAPAAGLGSVEGGVRLTKPAAQLETEHKQHTELEEPDQMGH